MVDTQHAVLDFGKHRGERWTRVPIGYLRWLSNESDGERKAMAEAEMARRGTSILTELEISAHAIDRASLNCRKIWHETSKEGEGIYTWLARIASEVMVPGALPMQRRVAHG